MRRRYAQAIFARIGRPPLDRRGHRRADAVDVVGVDAREELVEADTVGGAIGLDPHQPRQPGIGGQPVADDVPVPAADAERHRPVERGVTARAAFDLDRRLPRQRLQRDRLFGQDAGQSRLDVDRAHAADRDAVAGDDRMPGIETDARIAGDQRHARGARVGRQVVDHEQMVLADRERAHARLDRGLADVDADRRLEPLAVLVDQADQRDGDVEQRLDRGDDRVEPRLARRVEDRRPGKRRQPKEFVAVAVDLDVRHRPSHCHAPRPRQLSPGLPSARDWRRSVASRPTAPLSIRDTVNR